MTAVALIALLVGASPGSAAVVPSGFEDRLVTAVPHPTALAFTPDGRLVIASRSGKLRVLENGQLSPTPVLDISGRVCTNAERGLVGLALDPDFATNGHVYVYYTFKKHGVCTQTPLAPGEPDTTPVNRVSRFTISGNHADPASEVVLLDNIPSPKGIHNAGDVQFGRDGHLYITVGDGGCDYLDDSRCQDENDAARDRNVLLGKVLRITPTGGIPAGNPFTGSYTARCNLTGRTGPRRTCQEIYATGLRNPFRIAFDPDAAGVRFFINDVGGTSWEEVNRGRAGADYGWNLREGRCVVGSMTKCPPPPSSLTDPIHAYAHVRPGCTAITGGAFVPDGSWPPPYDDLYLFGDYVCGKILGLAPRDGGGFTKTTFATNLPDASPVAMAFDPYDPRGALYYTSLAGGGEVRAITQNSGNRRPVARVVGAPNYSSTLTIDLDGSASSDPDGDTPLSYLWDFGDGESAETTSPTTSHTYPTPGRRTVTLRVRDSQGAVSDPDTVDVFPGNTPPEPVIASPPDGARFTVDGEVALRGSATDTEDGAVPPTALNWEVLRHHNGDHSHPWFSGAGSDLTFKAPPPEGLRATDPRKNYLRIRLTATDSEGLSRTVARTMLPRTSIVLFESAPVSGLRIGVNGTIRPAPRSFLSWRGYRLNVLAPSPQTFDGRTWVFRSWSDGGAASHTIVTPARSTTYTARFRSR